jgi:hypothetical protein
MGKYRTLGTFLDRIFRNDLNANFNDVDVDIKAQKKRVDDLIVGTPQPSEVVDSRGGFPVLRDRLDDISSSVAQKATDINTLSDYLLPSTDTMRAATLEFNEPKNVKGDKKKKITNTNASATGDVRVNSSNLEINGLNTEGVSAQSIFFTGSTLDNIQIKNSKIKTSGHGVQINTPNVKNVTLENLDINADGFGILTNGGATNAKNLNILNNNIYSKSADAIELNNPTNIDTDSYKQVKVIGNTLIADEYGTSVNSGFAIGIANTRDVLVIGNMVEKSRQEALHIEDDQENVVVIGNIFNGCMENGAHILKGGFSASGKGQPVIVTQNVFVKKDLAKTDVGIYRVWDVGGVLESNLADNFIRGFDTGIWADGNALVNVNGTIAKDCNIALKAGARAKVNGTLFSVNCPTLVSAKEGSVIEKVVSDIVPTKIMDYSGATGKTGATLKGFTAKTDPMATTAGGTSILNIFSIPSMMKGSLTITGEDAGGNRIFASCDILFDGTNITTANLIKKSAGIFGSGITFTNNNGKLALNVFTGGATSISLNYDFTGTYYIES